MVCDRDHLGIPACRFGSERHGHFFRRHYLRTPQVWLWESRQANDKKALRIVRGMPELIMARRDFGGGAKACPGIHLNSRVCCAQDGEPEAGRVSKSELDRTGLKFRRLRE